MDTAVETADAPDIGKILILFATHSLINIAPGSETGVSQHQKLVTQHNLILKSLLFLIDFFFH